MRRVTDRRGQFGFRRRGRGGNRFVPGLGDLRFLDLAPQVFQFHLAGTHRALGSAGAGAGTPGPEPGDNTAGEKPNRQAAQGDQVNRRG